MSRIRRHFNTPLVYWDNPLTKGGQYIFEEPRELKGWIDQKNQTIINKKGEEITSYTQIIIQEELDENGFIYPESLLELSMEDTQDPRALRNALPIQKVEKNYDLRYKLPMWRIYL